MQQANGQRTVDYTSVVQRFYDQHPYPPPLSGLDGEYKEWSDGSRRRADFHLFWPGRRQSDSLDILVAGCGTSQAARYAARYPQSRITGIDVSATGMRHSEDLKTRYRLENLTLRQLEIERAGEIGSTFDLIICTGVLHHLPDPDQGMRALRGLMRSDGAMHLMVYATYGRTGIYMIQEYARRLGLEATDDEIGDLVAVLMELPDGHPLEHLLRTAPDFRRKPALADALLNPLDRAYSVPEFQNLLSKNGIRFGRWMRQAPYRPACGSIAQTPHAARLHALPNEEQYAAMELFRGTMVRHSAIVYHDEGASSFTDLFEDEHWAELIPVRLPFTRIISERLPAGSAAVLINQNHIYPDLYLPIQQKQLGWYRAIDGKSTIEEIVGKRKLDRQRNVVRRFFTELWQYDQIVVDATRTVAR